MPTTYTLDDSQSRDWLLQGLWTERPDNGWQTFHVYSGLQAGADRPRPQWPASQARRLRREGWRLRAVRRSDLAAEER